MSAGLAHTLEATWRRRHLVLGVMILCALNTAATMAFVRATYQVKAELLYTRDISDRVVGFSETEIFAEAFEAIKLMDQPEYNPALRDDTSVVAQVMQRARSMILGRPDAYSQVGAFEYLRTRVDIVVVPDGKKIEVTARADEPRLAPKIANQIALEYQTRLMPVRPVKVIEAVASWTQVKYPVWPRAVVGGLAGFVIGIMLAGWADKKRWSVVV